MSRGARWRKLLSDVDGRNRGDEFMDGLNAACDWYERRMLLLTSTEEVSPYVVARLDDELNEAIDRGLKREVGDFAAKRAGKISVSRGELGSEMRTIQLWVFKEEK